MLSDPVDSRPNGATPSPGGKPNVGNVKLNQTTLRKVTRRLVLVASGFLHQRLATDPEEQARDVWVATDDEQESIGDPVAAALGHHIGRAEIAPDVAELALALAGVIAYVANHAGEAWSIRRARRKLRQPKSATPPNEPGATA